jgi:hypothetical protein
LRKRLRVGAARSRMLVATMRSENRDQLPLADMRTGDQSVIPDPPRPAHEDEEGKA